MNILFTRFPLESRLGGAERQTISLMQGLLERGHAVAFAGSCPTLLALCRENHIPAAEWHIGPPPVTKWLSVSFFWRRFAMEESLRLLLRQFPDIDAVCMLSLSEKLLLTDEMAAAGKKVLWIEHDRIGRWLRKNPLLGRLKKQSAQAEIVTVSALSRRLMTEIGFEKSRVHAIPNGIDASRFQKLPARKEDDLFTIGCVARLTPDKGVPVLVEAVRTLPETYLTIVGDGPEQIRTTTYVRVWPSVDDVGAFYREIDLLVLPSIDNDPFGMVAAEAMLCGTPVIVTDQCGIAGSLTHDEDALIVPAGNVEALRAAIERVKTDDALSARLAAAGKKTAEKMFSLDAMVQAYASLLASKSPPRRQ